jgi:hypothetical protein
MTLEWVKRENADNVWDAECGQHHELTIIGGASFGVAVNGKHVGTRGTMEAAQEWCELIAKDLPPRPRNGELHLWTIHPSWCIGGRVYGDPRFKDGEEIKTGPIVHTDDDGDGLGLYVTTQTPPAVYLLASPERTAALIVKGYEAERANAEF